MVSATYDCSVPYFRLWRDMILLALLFYGRLFFLLFSPIGQSLFVFVEHEPQSFPDTQGVLLHTYMNSHRYAGWCINHEARKLTPQPPRGYSHSMALRSHAT